MRHFISIFSVFAMLAIVPMMAVTVPTQVQAANPTTPLVIIRFNQSRVSFERQLYGAIQKAVAIKPNLRVDVVSFIPVAQGAGQQAIDSRAGQNQQRVVQSLNKMGVSGTRLKQIRQYQPGIPSDEVHVFVK